MARLDACATVRLDSGRPLTALLAEAAPERYLSLQTMTRDWKRIRDVFEQALDVELRQRAAFFDRVCGNDVALRREVAQLLEEHERAGGFLSVPAPSPDPEAERRPPLERLLEASVARGIEEREAFLDAACGGDTELRAAVKALLDDRPTVAGSDGATGLLAAGTLIAGKYRIEGLLGEGGMGAVYRARHVALEREVAVKVMRAELVADAAAAERFRREAVAVARLRHPSIVTVHDFGVAPGVGAYLVMELLEGHSLQRELADRRRLEVDEALAVIRRVCDAVDAAHRAGVIHRDLKPENIFLERRSGSVAVKVVDFGLAKLASKSASRALTLAGAVLGTPAYMSPEQCRGEEVDARSDVYSLGCVLYELVTGRPPFGGTNVWALVYQHVNEPPRPPGEIATGLSPDVEATLLRALAKAPADRPQTAAELAKELAAPVGAPAAAPARAGARAEVPKRPHNLPYAMTSFVGRGAQLVEVRSWLARTRLVSLVGPGGIGKTRLALEVALNELDSYEHGAWIVELAPLADPESLVQAVASTLGVRAQGERTVLETLEGWLRDKRLLVILDNCEHLVAACAQLTERLLGGCAGLRVLATSRESLGVAGEVAWPVPALAVPAIATPVPGALAEAVDRDRLLECEAVRLFLDRAALAKPSFGGVDTFGPAVAELCRRLEGIPLAIELAAARVKVLSVDQILEKLCDRFRLLTGESRTAPTRQRALQTTLDWSYDLLSEDERALLRRLSVFAGGWDLDAAEAVASADTEDSLLDLLSRLVDKSLVTVLASPATARYGMLEMIREYAADRLAHSGEADAVRRRHAEYFLAQAEMSNRRISEGHSGEWLDRMEEDHDNVRAALGWALDNDPDMYLRIATAINAFRELRGHLTESRRCLETAISRCRDASAGERARTILTLGSLASAQGDIGEAQGFYEAAIPLAKEADDTRQMACAIYGLGALANILGNVREARLHLEECLSFSRQMQLTSLITSCHTALGEVARLECDWSAARAHYEQAVAISRDEGHDHFLVVGLCNLGSVVGDEDVDAACACYEEALGAARALRNTEYISLALDGLASVATKRGAWDRAARLAGAAEALLEMIGATLAPSDRAFRERYLAELRERLGESGLEAALVEGRALTQEQAVACALAV